MNSCILMAEILQEPELRYTSENQMAMIQMLVQFPGLRPEEPPATLRVVGWGNLATEIQQNYHQGDRIIIEGRLNMNTIDRSEGFKEKRAELTIQRIHPLGDGVSIGSLTSTPTERSTTLGTEQTRERSSAATPSDTTFAPVTPRPLEIESMPSNVRVQDVHHLDQSVPQSTTPKAPTYQSPASQPDVDDIPF